MSLCKILKSQAEIDEARARVVALGFAPNAGCPPKDWDLGNVLPELRDGNLLDMGCYGSVVLDNTARLAGDRVGVDLSPVAAPPGARTLVASLTDTGLPDGHFDAITCLSTIEHGVDIDDFAAEAARLLRPGGRLFVTFDYWSPKIHTGITMFGAPWNIFDRADAEDMIAKLAARGLRLVEQPDWTQGGPTLTYGHIQYTFGLLTFEKSPGVDVLIVNNKQETCGVYQFGKRLAETLQSVEATTPYRFRRVDCAGVEDFQAAVAERWPALVIVNYMPSTLPWLQESHMRGLGVPTVGIYHDIAQVIADDLQPAPFSHWMAPDPTLRPTAHCTPFGRPLPVWRGKLTEPEIPTIGTFGFGSYCKGHEKLIGLASLAWPRSRVRIHMPLTHADPPVGSVPHQVAAQARARAGSVGNVEVEITHDFWSTSTLLDWLASNTVNAFFYEESGQPRGISSALDYALAVPRPIALTRCSMFRHLLSPANCIDDQYRSLAEIAAAGVEHLIPAKEAFTAERIAADFTAVLGRLV